MNKQNRDLLNTLELYEKLDYAEKLVFGNSVQEQDLSSGQYLIKSEADKGNPKAEFLMYKLNLSRGKTVAAMNWLINSYNKGYGEALAMAFFEYNMGRLRGFKEKELKKSLEIAVKMNIPVANYIMGLLAEKNGRDKEAEKYYALAAERGFDVNYLKFTGWKKEDEKMTLINFRAIFQRQWLPELFLKNMDIYKDVTNNKIINEQIENIWNGMIESSGRNPAEYPLGFDAETYMCKNDKTYYSIIRMPELPKAKRTNLAIYAMAVFDVKNKRKPRFFLGETDYNTLDRYVFTVEVIAKNGAYMRRNLGLLAHREGYLRPVKKEEELEVFVANILDIYEAEDNLFKNTVYNVVKKFKR